MGSPRITAILDRAALPAARAVVCAERTEVQTLEKALVVSELRPDIRVVVELANAAVGAAVSQVPGPGTVLEVAGLATPSIVEGCLGSDSYRIELAGTRFEAHEVVVGRYASLRAYFGALAPVAVVPADGSPTVVCPGRDHMVSVGDQVTVPGTPAELADNRPGGRPEDDGSGLRVRHRPSGGRIRRMAAVVGSEDDGTLRLAMVAAGMLVALSTIVLHPSYRLPAGGHMPVLTATYFTVETISTVGFGDVSFSGQSTSLEVFGIVLIAGGAALLATVFALVTNVLVSWRIEQPLGR